MPKCLYCYEELSPSDNHFHNHCSKKIFRHTTAPKFHFEDKDIESLAIAITKQHKTVTGVQSKISLSQEFSNNNDAPNRFTITGLDGDYILKLPSQDYPTMPESEHLTMLLAQQTNLDTVPCSLFELQSKKLAYLTKRIDRDPKLGKIHMEDMCQIIGKQATHNEKYHGSYEQIAKKIIEHSSRPGLDLITYWKLVLFCFITGNSDMHLKNFSLFKDPKLSWILSPAYDLLPTNLLIPDDDEETALQLNGKKNKIKLESFIQAFQNSYLTEAQINLIINEQIKAFTTYEELVRKSFLSKEMQDRYLELMKYKMDKLFA